MPTKDPRNLSFSRFRSQCDENTASATRTRRQLQPERIADWRNRLIEEHNDIQIQSQGTDNSDRATVFRLASEHNKLQGSWPRVTPSNGTGHSLVGSFARRSSKAQSQEAGALNMSKYALWRLLASCKSSHEIMSARVMKYCGSIITWFYKSTWH